MGPESSLSVRRRTFFTYLFSPSMGPLTGNPYEPIIIPLSTTFKTGAHSSEPFQEDKGLY